MATNAAALAVAPKLARARWREGFPSFWVTDLPGGTRLSLQALSWGWKLAAHKGVVELWTARMGEDRTLDRAVAPVVSALAR